MLDKLNSPMAKQIKLALDKHEINTTLLIELSTLANDNPDQYCLSGTTPPLTPVSHLLLRHSRQPKKLQKIFKKLGIYNILRLRKQPGMYTYYGKAATGQVMMFEHVIEPGYNEIMACGAGILDFIRQITTGEYTMPADTDLPNQTTTLTSAQMEGLRAMLQSSGVSDIDISAMTSSLHVSDIQTTTVEDDLVSLDEETSTVVRDENGIIEAEFTEI
jgi:hypothetical protein